MDTDEHITFGENPIFGALAIILPDMAIDFHGDLLSLTVLDVFATRYGVPVSLSKVWEKLLDAGEIARFTIACGKGHGVDMTEMSLTSTLKSKAQTSLCHRRDMKSRTSLLAVLEDMNAQLDADEEEEMLDAEYYGTSPRAPDPDYESGAFYDHEEMLESDDSYRKIWEEREVRAEDRRTRRRLERKLCRTIIRLSLETAANGPAAHFRVYLRREGMTKLNTGDLQANEPESGPGGENGSQMAAASQPILSLCCAHDRNHVPNRIFDDDVGIWARCKEERDAFEESRRWWDENFHLYD